MADLSLVFGTIGVSQMISDLARLEGKALSLSGVFSTVAANLASPASIAAIGTIIKDVAADSVEAFADFEQSIADLQAITGAAGSDLEYFKNQARELGIEVEGGATAAAKAFELIGSAKPELLENSKALAQLTKDAVLFSQASGLQLPEAATALTDALNQFKAPASEAVYYMDTLAAGAKYGAAAIPEATQALLRFGAGAKAFNVDIRESTAAIQLFSLQGLKGAEAGTAMRNILLKMQGVKGLGKEALEGLKRARVDISKVSDASLPLIDRLREMGKAFNDEVAPIKVFGTENVNAAQILFGSLDRYEELAKQVGEVGGAAAAAAIRTNTLSHAFLTIKNRVNDALISIGEALKPVIDEFVEGFVPAFEMIKEAWMEIQMPLFEFLSSLGDLGVSLGIVKDEGNKLVNVVKFITDSMKAASIGSRILFKVLTVIVEVVIDVVDAINGWLEQFPALQYALDALLLPLKLVTGGVSLLMSVFSDSSDEAENAKIAYGGLIKELAGVVAGMGGTAQQATDFAKSLDTAQFAGLKKGEMLELLKFKFKIYLDAAKNATAGTDDLAKAFGTATGEAGPLAVSIDFINKELNRLRLAFNATDSDLKRIALGKAIEGYEFQLMKFSKSVDYMKAQTADTFFDPNYQGPARTLEAMGEINTSIAETNDKLTLTGQIIQLLSQGAGLDRALASFEILKEGAIQIGDAFKQFAIDAAFAFGQAIAGAGSFGQAMSQLLIGLGATISKLAGMALLNASIALGPTPAALVMALAGLGLVGLSGLLSGLGSRNQAKFAAPSVSNPSQSLPEPNRRGLDSSGSGFGGQMEFVMEDGERFTGYVRRKMKHEDRRRG